jgi:hypothetical protein
MKRIRFFAIAVLAVAVLGFLAIPAGGHTPAPAPRSAPFLGISAHAGPDLAAHPVLPRTPHPATGFPRVVLAEPFTELWCQWCPYESQGMYNAEHSSLASHLIVTELHPCVTGNYANCQDSWPTLDGIADYRASPHVYNIQGYPTVEFDGTHAIVGAVSTNIARITQYYENAIANASAVPGNVSISQTALITTGNNVTVHETIQSDISGTYLALTYLAEHIGKNVSGTGGVHDIGTVVRASVIDENVTLVAGQTLTLTGSTPLTPSWNTDNLSTVALVQDSSTLIIQNANQVPVETVATAMQATSLNITSHQSTSLTLTATNSSSGSALAGAQVSLSSAGGGTFSPASGVTAADGTFNTTFFAPNVTAVETFPVTANVTEGSYVHGSASVTLTVNPSYAPSVPLGLGVAPSSQGTLLQWSAPATGGGGVTYYVYRATSTGGPFSFVGTSASPTFVDPSVAAGTSYWYTVSAANLQGFSLNTSAVAAISVLTTPQGLPGDVGWWATIGGVALTQPNGGGLPLHLAPGSYDYSFGADSYAWLAPNNTGNFHVALAALGVEFAFTPNYAILQGTVSPANATVQFNGSAVNVTGGLFYLQEIPGVYDFKVSAPGYQTKDSQIALTPGNQTTLIVKLTANAATPHPSTPSTSSGGLSAMELGALTAVGAVAAVAVVGALLWRRRRGGASEPTPSNDASSNA